MAEVLLGLGSNLGDKAANLRSALASLGQYATVLEVSSLWRTEPVGYLAQDWFLNAAAAVETSLAPRALLQAVLDVEQRHGRIRTTKFGPRTLDIDLLLWGDVVLEEADLQIPHPRMHERLFVLAPLREIRPEAYHPVLNATVETLYHRVADDGGVSLHGPMPEISAG